MREPTEGKIGRAVLTIALVMATAMLVLAVATLIGLDRTTAVQGPADARPRGASRCPASTRAVRARATVSTDHPETPASVTIVALGSRARCTVPRCKNLGRMILRYADAGGRPMSSSEFCNAHARVRVARDRAAGSRSTTVARFALQPTISRNARRPASDLRRPSSLRSRP